MVVIEVEVVFLDRLDGLKSDPVGWSAVGCDSNGDDGRKYALLSPFLRECCSRFLCECKVVVRPMRFVYWFKWHIFGGRGHPGVLGRLDHG